MLHFKLTFIIFSNFLLHFNIPFTFENCYTGSGTDSFIGTYAGFSEGTYLRSCTEFYTGLFTGTCRDKES